MQIFFNYYFIFLFLLKLFSHYIFTYFILEFDAFRSLAVKAEINSAGGGTTI